MTVSISDPLYEALRTAALAGNVSESRRLCALVDSSNSISRYYLYVRWQDVGGTRPTRIELGNGTSWPSNQTYLIEMTRPITSQDVDEVLTQAVNPVDVHVTPDAQGRVGWTLLEDYDFSTGT